MAAFSSTFFNPSFFTLDAKPERSAFTPNFFCTPPTTSFPPLSFRTRRHRFNSTITASLKENLGRVTKTWRDFTSLNYWVVRDYYRLVGFVNSFEPQIQKLSDEQLTAKTAEFRRRLGKGETLADIQAEAFAVVREAAKRKLGMRHFDVQIIGGAVLNDGSIAEMKTGEGKTLVSTLAAYLNALTGEGVHVVTVNDYLAQRDAEWMGRVHRFLGLSVGLIQRGMKAEERRSNYRCDITYTNNSELGFDYLRDNLAGSSGQLVMRWPKPFHFAIVDEVDSVLIDEGRNPLLISGEASKDAARYPVAAKVAELLTRGLHYKIELKDNSVELTEEGINLAEMALETNDLWDENDPWARFVMNALKAKEFYRQDVQYIVKNGKALIINELTGRVEEKRRLSEGIHQAVEAKEGLPIQADSVIVAQITYQSLFKLYPKLSGMTGTAKTKEKEFLKMFQTPVIEVPTNMPNIRNDLPIQAFAENLCRVTKTWGDVTSLAGLRKHEELSPELSNRYIRWLCEAGNIDKAMDFLSQMEALGFRLSYASYTCLLTALASAGRTSEAEAILQEMVTLGFHPRQKVYNILLKGILTRGLLTVANRVMESMNDLGVLKNRETYEILLGYYVSAGRLNDSWEVVANMRKDGFEPNSFVYSRIIELYRDNGMWKKATNLVEEIRNNGVVLDKKIFNSIIDTFGKSGELEDALQVFDKMLQEGITPDITTWNSLIQWHCKHGDLTNALRLFDDMQAQGLYPDPSIFVTIISRLGEQGKWDVINKTFDRLKHGGHRQSELIYAVLVDIYGQNGRFEDAEECINTFKLEGVPLSARIFCVLANAYAQQGLCEQTVKVLQLMEREGIEPNLIMLNVLINAFGIAGRHLEALSVYQHIKESGVSPDVVTYTTIMKALIRAKEFDKVPLVYEDMEASGCSPDRKARQLLQNAMMVLQRRH